MGSLRLRLQKLQKANSKAQKQKSQKTNSYEKIDVIFQH